MFIICRVALEAEACRQSTIDAKRFPAGVSSDVNGVLLVVSGPICCNEAIVFLLDPWTLSRVMRFLGGSTVYGGGGEYAIV